MEVSIAAVSLKDWREIIKKAVEQAKRGDQQARKFLAEYLIGPPQQRLDVTSGGEKLKIEVEYVNSPIATPSLPSGTGEN